ncbi:hypothetical protein KSP39_PZI006611 [Platanthera zijinensis]|uniref:Uncharacterized protein n=1 Tax=Platanthera zijinensis TaxID=2320716 RepID=A0AAP0BQY2_9ASPA
MMMMKKKTTIPKNKDHGAANDPYLMTEEERLDMRRKIREVINMNPIVQEERDPVQHKIMMQKLLADYPLVVEEDDPDWTDDADGRGFKFDQFFNNIRIKNVRKVDDDGPRENVVARDELERAVKLFWETGLPSPRCVAVDAVVEDELAEALQVTIFPEIIFTKAGKILHRDKVVRTAEEWSKMMAFFYYKAVRPPCLDKTAGLNQERLPSLK